MELLLLIVGLPIIIMGLCASFDFWIGFVKFIKLEFKRIGE